MAKRKKLPEKLSELIEVALNDLDLCEKDPRYKIDMWNWHRPNSHCSVCFAGSVMAKTFGLGPDEHIMEERTGNNTFSARDWNKFHALDHVRKGAWAWALSDIGFDLSLSEQNQIQEILPDWCRIMRMTQKALKKLWLFQQVYLQRRVTR